jgi:hypothetical protein
MLKHQVMTLQQTGSDLLAKATRAPTAKETSTLTDLALRCFSEARMVIAAQTKASITLYLECCLHLGVTGDYPHYVEFCIRNGLETLCLEDFTAIEQAL